MKCERHAGEAAQAFSTSRAPAAAPAHLTFGGNLYSSTTRYGIVSGNGTQYTLVRVVASSVSTRTLSRFRSPRANRRSPPKLQIGLETRSRHLKAKFL